MPRWLPWAILPVVMLAGWLPALAASAPAGEPPALAAINQARARVNVPPLVVDPALQSAAAAHVEYYRLNYGDPALAGMGLHQETAGRPGFTGAEPEDRAVTAGYGSRYVNENAGLTGDLLKSVAWHLDTVNHRLPLLDPRYTGVGLAGVAEGTIRFDVVLVGAPAWPATATPEWVAWPSADSTGHGLSFSGEAPAPFPGARYPLGLPVTLAYFGAGTVVFTGASLTPTGGTAVGIVFRQGIGWHSRRSALLAATEPLRPGTAYTVEIAGTLDGQAFTRRWQFTTRAAAGTASPRPSATATATVGATAAPTASPTPTPQVPDSERVATVDVAITALWERTDGRVEAGATNGWLWGPARFDARLEPYAESPAGRRLVVYYDKSRMEITDPGASRASDWYVTNGLLVREMVTGRVQTGDQRGQQRPPATVPVAGDPGEPGAPTFATFASLVSGSADDRRALARPGQPVSATLAGDGTVGVRPDLGRLARVAYYSQTLGHNVPDVFWQTMSTLPMGWQFAVGLPISEAYWVRVRVGGVERDVLVQLFERRVLTYTPANPPGWRVEMGNVGRQYHAWRYA